MNSSQRGGRPRTAPGGVSLCVPIRRSRWVSFWVGAAALVVATLSAAAAAAVCGSLLMLLGVEADGFWLLFLFALLSGGLFFLSYPRQRRFARALDSRRPGISLTDGVLTVPVTRGSTLHFKLNEPHELLFGWWEYAMTGAGGPTTRTRAVWTHATLSQAGRGLYLIAEDSIREALAAGWRKVSSSETPAHARVCLWAGDLVALVEAVRATRHDSDEVGG